MYSAVYTAVVYIQYIYRKYECMCFSLPCKTENTTECAHLRISHRLHPYPHTITYWQQRQPEVWIEAAAWTRR